MQFDEFKKGIHDYGLTYTNDEIKEVFNAFDRDHSGTIDFDEFLERLRVIAKFKFLWSLIKFSF